jgi:hypothetical protein
MDVKTSDGWIRSSYSGGQGNCLDHKIVTNDRGQREVWVRDSKDPGHQRGRLGPLRRVGSNDGDGRRLTGSTRWPAAMERPASFMASDLRICLLSRSHVGGVGSMILIPRLCWSTWLGY